MITNNGPEAVTLTSLVDDVWGTLLDAADPTDDVILAPAGEAGDSTTITITRWVEGDFGVDHENIVTATAEDDDGNSDEAKDDEIVEFTDDLPDISVVKTADPTSVPESGADVEFTFVITNNGPEAVTLTSLVDDVWGTLLDAADPTDDVILAPAGEAGDSTTITITRWVEGDFGVDHENIVTATAEDDDGNSDEAKDNEIVEFTDDLPDISVVKTADPTSVPESGADVEFTFVITNNGPEAVTLTSLVDDVWGTLLDAADPTDDVILAPAGEAGDSTTITITRWVEGDFGVDHENIVTATAEDDDGNSDEAKDNEIVEFTDDLPDISVVKTADPTIVPESGGWVTFTFVITNNGDEMVTFTSLVDDVFGDISAECDLPQDIAPHDSYTCSITRWIEGDYPDSHHNVSTATAEDDDGNKDTETDDETVDFVEPGSITGLKYNDVNANGVLDEGIDTPWDGSDIPITVMLYKDDVQIDTDIIDSADGTFEFSDLEPGDYEVTEIIPEGKDIKTKADTTLEVTVVSGENMEMEQVFLNYVEAAAPVIIVPPVQPAPQQLPQTGMNMLPLVLAAGTTHATGLDGPHARVDPLPHELLDKGTHKGPPAGGPFLFLTIHSSGSFPYQLVQLVAVELVEVVDSHGQHRSGPAARPPHRAAGSSRPSSTSPRSNRSRTRKSPSSPWRS